MELNISIRTTYQHTQQQPRFLLLYPPLLALDCSYLVNFLLESSQLKGLQFLLP